MKNRVVIIIPYFGKFPNYFNFWLKSALFNSDFDFLIFTDNKTYITQSNVKFIQMDFKHFKNLLQRKVEFPICLNKPYKLCDYKPLYGSALQKYIVNYEFWGFADIDLILGTLNKFVTPQILDDYEKIYNLGHLTLLKNNKKCNSLWKVKHHLSDAYRYDEAFRTPYICHFDESDGLSKIAQLRNIRTYNSVDFGDIDRSKFNFFMIGKQHKIYPGIFFWNKGHLIYLCKQGKRILHDEVAYAHFQKRRFSVSKIMMDNKNQFVIIPNRIIVGADPDKYL